MKVQVTDLIPGDRIISDVFNDYGIPVLPKDTVISQEEIHKLLNHKIDFIEIAARKILSTEMKAPTDANVLKVHKHFVGAVDGIKDLFEEVTLTGKIEEAKVQLTFEPLVESLGKERDIVSLLIQLNSQDDYTYKHSVQVGMISYFLARWIGYPEQESINIGKAGYLHDIGKSRIPLSILQKPSKLTPEEFEEVKRHTLYGQEIIRNSLQNEEFALVALQHHERMNGTGYPHEISNEQIHPYSRIVAVADIYSAMISSRVYQRKRDLLNVLRELHRLSFEELDPQVTHTFIKNMIPNFIGKKIVLRTGEVGEIIMTNPSDFFRPLIRIDGHFIDLSQRHNLEIDSVLI